MSDQSVEARILDIFSRRGALPTDRNILETYDYVENGLVDSLGLMTLVSEIEETLDIDLEEDDFMQDGFRTIGGLIHIVSQRVAG